MDGLFRHSTSLRISVSQIEFKFKRDKFKQVAQLWQRNRAKLDAFSINVQRYSQNHKIAFLGHPMGRHGQYNRLI